MVSIIAAVAENRVIGAGNGLPWRLPEDMRHFKRLTTGHTVVMGRKTFETLPKPLPNRRNVVVTRDLSYRAAGAEVVHSLSEALNLVSEEDDVFIAGGGEIYRMALPVADRLYLTVVHTEAVGDTLFPEFPDEDWELIEDIRNHPDEQHAFPYSFRQYRRRKEKPAQH
ncbi:MAG: dihydrofolate reductase [Gemmatimonadota bacterium]|nr:MAG: dihydrofolate reductase [Gemmatimonadota bacterium]